jgi:hypothetical protein
VRGHAGTEFRVRTKGILLTLLVYFTLNFTSLNFAASVSP